MLMVQHVLAYHNSQFVEKMIVAVSVLCLIGAVLGGTPEKSIHMTLLSIDDRLRSLENSLTLHCGTTISGHIEYYGRKIESIEKELARFQRHVRIELDKISENISSRNFLDEIDKSRVERKIEVVYERLNHKLGNVEGQIDMINVKSQNGREVVLTKFEKMEESMTIRDADIEAELADAVAAIDDLKSTYTSMEETIINTTKEIIKSNEKLMRKQHSQTIAVIEAGNKILSVNVQKSQETLNTVMNQTNATSWLLTSAKNKFGEDLNEYANKILDLYSDLWSKSESLAGSLEMLIKVTNATRNEQQNGLRALTVQVGRNPGKGVQADDSGKLEELGRRIDSNFENVMLAQNLFLESCHRVQMDEAQLESQISVVLDKLIDIFENKTSVSPKDIQQLATLIQNHDSNLRKSTYHIANSLLDLIEKTANGNDEIASYINNHRKQVDMVYLLMKNYSLSNSSEQINQILKNMQDFQNKLRETHQQTHLSLTEIKLANNLIEKILNTSHPTDTQLQQTLDFIRSIYQVLTGIEIKLSKFDMSHLPKRAGSNKIGKKLGRMMISKLRTKTNQSTSSIPNITEIIFACTGRRKCEKDNTEYITTEEEGQQTQFANKPPLLSQKLEYLQNLPMNPDRINDGQEINYSVTTSSMDVDKWDQIKDNDIFSPTKPDKVSFINQDDNLGAKAATESYSTSNSEGAIRTSISALKINEDKIDSLTREDGIEIVNKLLTSTTDNQTTNQSFSSESTETSTLNIK